MREIKFRAIGHNTKDFVYGDFYQGELNSIICWLEHTNPTYSEPSGGQALIRESVDINTLGQFTGVKDFFENDIYDGDIVFLDSKMLRGEIINDDINWRIKFENGDLEWLCDYFEQLHVIGNIHENSELLKCSHQ